MKIWTLWKPSSMEIDQLQERLPLLDQSILLINLKSLLYLESNLHSNPIIHKKLLAGIKNFVLLIIKIFKLIMNT